MSPQPQRHFIGWDQPLLHLASEWLSSRRAGGMVDLSDWLVIVPTRHAGRRLREHLALTHSRSSGGLLPPTVVTPQSLIAMGLSNEPLPDRQLLLAAWVEVLRALPEDACGSLFPAGVRKDLGWALPTANRLVKLQHDLGEKGLTIQDVSSTDEGLAAGNEPDRWQDLARLEQALERVLSTLGMASPTRARAAAARALTPPPGITHVALIGVPDPLPLALDALESLSRTLPTHVVIHAPQALADRFDDWGRPLVDEWSGRTIDIPDSAIEQTGGPDGMGPALLSLMEGIGVAPVDLAIGVPDPAVIPHIERALSEAGLQSHDPSGFPLVRHPVLTLLAQLVAVREHGQFSAVATLLRHSDYLRLLAREGEGLSVETLLLNLDDFQNTFLPETLGDIRRLLKAANARRYPALRQAIALLETHLAVLDEARPGRSLLSLLARTYTDRSLDLNRPSDRAFQAAARALSDLLTTLDRPVYERLSLSSMERFALLRQSLAGLAYYLERDAEAVDLLGWLELHWDDAPWLVVTGMNDGFVPETVVGDAFLPDAVRRDIGLSCNATRFARDAYILAALAASRESTDGTTGLKFIVPRVSAQNDPLRPSRLLLACSEEHLAGRVTRLFHDVPPPQTSPATPQAWRLKPPLGPLPAVLSATALRDYLQCPFRFYLKWVLRMGTVDDRVNELDPMQFGTLCHDALEAMGRNKDLAASTNGEELAVFLESELDRRANHWFAGRAPIAVQVQLDAARQRLRWAARVEAEQRLAGWHTISVESDLGTRIGHTLGTFPMRGRVDRIDRHDDGSLRVLDYKTRENSLTPAKAHLKAPRDDAPDWQLVTVGGKEREWVDLQLPLYAHYLSIDLGAPVRAGYFELPRAVSQTAVTLFEELDSDVLGSAIDCAQNAADAIADWQFWPPRKATFDEFQSVFSDSPEQIVDVDDFLALLAAQRKEVVR